MNLGRITTDQGEYADTAAGRLYRWLRANTGRWYTGQDMDVTFYAEHRCRAASTRKSEICHQVDPRTEWIEHDIVVRDGQNVQRYRHVLTGGRCPAAPGALARLKDIMSGEGEPVRGLGLVTVYGPAHQGKRRSPRPRPAPAPAMAMAQADRLAPPADRLFDDRPTRCP